MMPVSNQHKFDTPPELLATRNFALELLAPKGSIRVGINFSNIPLARRPSDGGEPSGVAIDMAHALAATLDIPYEIVGYDAAGKVTAASEEWDVSFLAVDPTRAERFAFTPAYVQIGACYMVSANSALLTSDMVDRPNHRISAAKDSGYELYLSRTLRHAQLERFPTAQEALASFEIQRIDAAACIRGVLQKHVATRPHLRLMNEDFLKIDQALCVPRARLTDLNDGFQWLCAWVEERKKSGFVKMALERCGQFDVTVAPLNAIN